jgi:hypothetical protein
MIVGYTRADLGVVGLRNVVHLGRSARVTHGQVILGTVSGTVGALAAGFAAALVALDERAAQDRLQRRQFVQQEFAAVSEDGSGFVCHPDQTTCITGLIVVGRHSFCKLLLAAIAELLHQRDQIEQKLN